MAGLLKDKVFIGPEKVSFHLTNVCNLNCVYCWRHSILNVASPTAYKKEELDIEKFKRVIDDCRDLKVRRIQFSSQGEPTLHRYFCEMTGYVKKWGFFLTILTNGTFDTKTRQYVKKADEIKFDLSAASPQEYKKVQSGGASGLFERVLENIAYLSSLKKTSKKAPAVKLNFIINAYNYDRLPEIFGLARRFAVDHLNVLTVSVTDRTGSVGLTSRMAGVVRKTLKKMFEAGLLEKVSNNVLLNYRACGDFLNRPSAARVCYNGWYHIFIGFNGNVSVCCKVRNIFVAGNINKDTLRDIWGSERFHRLRLQGKYGFWGRRIDKCRSCCFHKFNNGLFEKMKRFSGGRLCA